MLQLTSHLLFMIVNLLNKFLLLLKLCIELVMVDQELEEYGIACFILFASKHLVILLY